jgi:hypothetical protein
MVHLPFEFPVARLGDHYILTYRLGAMSQLAALIEKGEDLKATPTKTKAKIDPIAAILSSAGVQYTHENSEVVGTSKVEAELSRRAQEAGNDVDYGEQRLFAESQSQMDDPSMIQYEFHPPEDVMIRQFCTMATTFGFESATEFALVVEGWTQKQRTDCLERFYLKRRARLMDMASSDRNNSDVSNIGISGNISSGGPSSSTDAPQPNIVTETQTEHGVAVATDFDMDLKVPDTPPDVAAGPVIESETESEEDDEL